MKEPSAHRLVLWPLVLAAALTSCGLTAQKRAWRLPAGGFAEFERETTAWRIAPSQQAKRGGLERPVDAGSSWRVRTWPNAPVADGFQVREFDDSAWRTARLPLRTERPADDAPWPETGSVLDGRTTFEVPRGTKGAILTIEHEDHVRAWLNGVELIDSESDGNRRRTELVFTRDDLRLFERGPNVLSFQVRNPSGGSYVGVELVVAPRPFDAPEDALARIERIRQEAARLQGSMFTGWRAPAVLCDGELDPDREHVARPPVDLRDLGAFVAFDLRRAEGRGKVEFHVPLSWKLGEMAGEGRAEPPASDGRQRIVLEVEGDKPSERAYESRFYEREVLRWWEYGFEGELSVDRWYDDERGVVSRFDTRLVGVLTVARGEDAGRSFELEFAETWTLKAVREPRDAEFRAAVVEAIRKGAEFVRKAVENPNSDRLKAGGENRTYPSGRLALALLALIHAEIPRDDPVLVAGLDELRRRELIDTYSLANAIMAIEAYYQPRGEYEELRSGTIERPRERRLTDADMKAVRRWTAKLLENMDTRVDPAYLARWSYVKEARYDHSVNQYGLLGLYSAHLCGVEISPQIWRGAAAHLADSQQKPERRTDLELVSYRQLAAQQDGGTSTTSGRRRTGVAGWGYVEAEWNGEPRPVYGSMTCAGLTGLTIALAGMRDSGLTRDAVLGEAEEALRMGFAWLAENMTARWHPGPGSVASYYSHVYYYLYGLERACELSSVARINGHDWYLEGALALLAHQHANGSWPDMTGGEYDAPTVTAMAILFLKKSSMPVYTHR